jgi:hypothetical protein
VGSDSPVELGRRSGSPIVDEGGATFVWHGDGPAPDRLAALLDALPATFPPPGT